MSPVGIEARAGEIAARPRTVNAPPWAWVIAAVASAFLVGALAPFNPVVSVVLTLALIVVAVSLLDPSRLLLLLVATVFLEIVSFGGVTITRVAGPLALFLLVAAYVRGTARVVYGPPIAWAAGYTAWALSSMLWTVNDGESRFLLSSLAIALVYLLSFAALVNTTATLRSVMMAFTIGSFALGVFAILAFFGIAGSTTLEQGRAGGAVGDANFFAAYQLVALPLVIVLANHAGSSGVRAFAYVTAAVNVVSVITTLSRGGLITLAAVILLAIVLPARTMFRSKAQKAAAVAVIVIGSAIMLQSASEVVIPRFTALVSVQGDGGSGREVLWRAAQTSIEERPVLGLGYGAFALSANELILRTPDVSLTDYELRPKGQPAHNLFIGTLAELGVPGLVLVIGLLISTGRWLRRTARLAFERGEDFVGHVANALVVGLVAWAVSSLFLSSETSRPLWMLIGLSLALPKLLESTTEAPDAGADEPAVAGRSG